MNKDNFNKWIEESSQKRASMEVHSNIDQLSSRKKKKRIGKIFVFAPLSVIIAFVLLVNFVTPVYVWAMETPLKDLVSAIKFTDTYYQKVLDSNQYQKLDEIIMIEGEEITLEYLIAEDKVLSIVYKGSKVLDQHVNVLIPNNYIFGIGDTSYDEYRVISFNLQEDLKDNDEINILINSGEMISINYKEIIENTPVIFDINKTIHSKGSKLTVESLEVKGISSVMSLNIQPKEGYMLHSKLIKLIDNNDRVTSGTYGVFDPKTGKLELTFAGGQVIWDSLKEIQIQQLIWIKPNNGIVSYDVGLNQFSDLPEGIRFKSYTSNNNQVSFEFEYDEKLKTESSSLLNIIGNYESTTEMKGGTIKIVIEGAPERKYEFGVNIDDLVDMDTYKIDLR